MFLLFGGCYSNLQATQALLDQATRLNIPPEKIFCTGDIIAYGADAAATLRLIRNSGIRSIAGNCEESLSISAPDCACGFAPGSACDELATRWYAHAARQVTDEDRRYMSSLPKHIEITLEPSVHTRHAGEGRHPRLSSKPKKLIIAHGNVERTNAFVFPSVSTLELDRQLTLAGADIIIAGHSGIPFTRHVGGKIWHNPGSIGMPANDGTPRGWFSTLKIHGDEIVFTPHPLHYDHEAAATAMRRAGLPEGYATALETGIWPSLDILPAADKYFTGVRLEDQKTAEPAPVVKLEGLETLWVNTGTLCNLACTKCFMESTPTNDSLSYFPLAALEKILAEAPPELSEIDFTGGEPFMNPDIMPMLQAALGAGKRVLVLTNAMRPMQRHATALAGLIAAYPGQLSLRVSLDHYLPDRHEALRGADSFAPTINGLKFLAEAGATLSIASRTPWGETEAMMQAGFTRLFADHGLPAIPLILFPEMDSCASQALPVTARAVADVPSEKPLMCRTSRMVLLRKGETAPRIAPCTLLPDSTLAAWDEPVTLEHPHCAQFCVYGGASCAGAPG
jgi:pyruvate-formate lyase-activating enzyme